MATIDLGKIKQVWRGTYNNGTAYTVDDLVEYTDTGITSSYICVANSTGNAPSSSGTAHASWNYVAKGVDQSIVQSKFQRFNSIVSMTSTTYADTGMTLTMTPTSASNKLVLQGSISVSSEDDTTLCLIVMMDSGSGFSEPEETRGPDRASRSRCAYSWGYQEGGEEEYTIKPLAFYSVIDCDNTNAHTVKIQMANRDGTGKQVLINRSYHDNNAQWMSSPTSHITLSEVEMS